jgi:hypothetical protein
VGPRQRRCDCSQLAPGQGAALAAEHRELRRRELVARFRISRELARRELASLVRLWFFRLIGHGRGARYVPLWLWLSLMGEAAEWTRALV